MPIARAAGGRNRSSSTPSKHKDLASALTGRTQTSAQANLLEGDGANRVYICGQISKRGSKLTDAFISRWVSITGKHVAYSKYENTAVIDRIELEEVIGFATRQDSNDNDEGRSECQDMQDPCDAGLELEGSFSKKKSGRNEVFWRLGRELMEEKRKAFTYELKPEDFALFTAPAGFHRGRVFVFSCPSVVARERWSETLTRILICYKDRKLEKRTQWYIARKRLRSFYVGDYCQIGVAIVIMVGAFTRDRNAHLNCTSGHMLTDTCSFDAFLAGELRRKCGPDSIGNFRRRCDKHV